MATTETAAAREGKLAAQSITPWLAFKDQCEEALNFYVSIFENSRIVRIDRSESDATRVPKGKVLNAIFELNGREFRAFDGGEHFTFSDGFSIGVTVETQRELDQVWERLIADGGQEVACGWVTDKFGVSWQVIPVGLDEMMLNPQGGDSAAAIDAFLKMVKPDIKALEAAYRKR